MRVGVDAADHVVRRGVDRDQVLRRVDLELIDELGELREALAELGRRQVPHVEEHVREVRLADLLDDRPADDVARRELAVLVIVGHEAVAVAVDEVRAFAAHGFGDQRAAGAGDVERRRVELHHLHVLQRRPGAVRHRVPVGGRDLRVGRFAVELPRPAAGEDRALGPDDVDLRR